MKFITLVSFFALVLVARGTKLCDGKYREHKYEKCLSKGSEWTFNEDDCSCSKKYSAPPQLPCPNALYGDQCLTEGQVLSSCSGNWTIEVVSDGVIARRTPPGDTAYVWDNSFLTGTNWHICNYGTSVVVLADTVFASMTTMDGVIPESSGWSNITVTVGDDGWIHYYSNFVEFGNKSLLQFF